MILKAKVVEAVDAVYNLGNQRDSHLTSRSLIQRRRLPHVLLILQWHITERCNLRCEHCYQEEYSNVELSFQDLRMVVEQFKKLLDQRRQEIRPHKLRGHINVSGGEPFIRQDFLDLLEIFFDNREHFSFGILTNGTFIDAAMARRLGALSPASVQVSIEGTQATNDGIRGKGVYDQTVEALKNLIQEEIRTVISFTAHRKNFREFLDVAHLGRHLKVSRVWADRLIPWGTGSSLKQLLMSPAETREFFEVMYTAHSEAAATFCQTEISMGRALQFLIGGGTPYRCGAGDRLITIQPNGDLYPCRRMPIRVGNVLDTPLDKLYYECELFQTLREHRISEGCEDCNFASQCGGGLKCLSYALTGDPLKADPGCWRVSVKGSKESDMLHLYRGAL